jgi:hypothetical protein
VKKTAKKKAKARKARALLKLDLGCGPNKKEGFFGVDSHKFDRVDLVLDLTKPWPWKAGSVGEAHSSHFLEHLTAPQRIHFFNELYRVMAPEAKALIVTPHWSSGRAYGDPTHQWPPVVEFFWYYLNREWRQANAPHVPLVCNFEVTWGYNIHAGWLGKNVEQQQFGVNHYREVAQDLISTLVRK